LTFTRGSRSFQDAGFHERSLDSPTCDPFLVSTVCRICSGHRLSMRDHLIPHPGWRGNQPPLSRNRIFVYPLPFRVKKRRQSRLALPFLFYAFRPGGAITGPPPFFYADLSDIPDSEERLSLSHTFFLRKNHTFV
jgi:hypothetical protein